MVEKGYILVQGNVFTISISKKVMDLGASVALDASDFGAAVVDQSAPNLPRFLPVMKEIAIQRVRRWFLNHDQLHCFLLRKVAFHAQNASWEEACFVLERVVCSMVNEDCAMWLQSVQ